MRAQDLPSCRWVHRPLLVLLPIGLGEATPERALFAAPTPRTPIPFTAFEGIGVQWGF